MRQAKLIAGQPFPGCGAGETARMVFPLSAGVCGDDGSHQPDVPRRSRKCRRAAGLPVAALGAGRAFSDHSPQADFSPARIAGTKAIEG
jgi:hypothetical protein